MSRVTLEPVDVERDAGLLHRWVTHPRSVFWQMTDASVADVALGRVDGAPAFLAETYDPARSELVGLTGLPELREGDLGMHVLVAPTDRPVPGFTRRVLGAVMDHCFADPAVARVVVEPDVRNARIARLNAEAGFTVARVVALPGKDAALSFCTRAAFARSRLALEVA
jgi:RimJ/RimL family protein N-acetyltransferase